LNDGIGRIALADRDFMRSVFDSLAQKRLNRFSRAVPGVKKQQL